MKALVVIALVAVALVACGDDDEMPSPTRYVDACTAFCENRYDCFGDPDGRRASCPGACVTPPAGRCESAAFEYANCLASLSCAQLSEPDGLERYCGSRRVDFERECMVNVDGGAG